MEKNQEVLHTFLDAWKHEAYDIMFEMSQKAWQEGKEEKNIQALFSVAKLKDFEVISSTHISPSAMRFATELTLASGDKVVSAINVICEAAPYKPVPFGDWGVNPISVMNVVQKIPKKKPAAKKPDSKPKK